MKIRNTPVTSDINTQDILTLIRGWGEPYFNKRALNDHLKPFALPELFYPASLRGKAEYLKYLLELTRNGNIDDATRQKSIYFIAESAEALLSDKVAAQLSKVESLCKHLFLHYLDSAIAHNSRLDPELKVLIPEKKRLQKTATELYNDILAHPDSTHAQKLGAYYFINEIRSMDLNYLIHAEFIENADSLAHIMMKDAQNWADYHTLVNVSQKMCTAIFNNPTPGLKCMEKSSIYAESFYRIRSGHPDHLAYLIGQAEAAFVHGEQRVGTMNLVQCTLITVRCTDKKYNNLTLVMHKDFQMNRDAMYDLLFTLPQNTPWDIGLYASAGPIDPTGNSRKNLYETLDVLRSFPNATVKHTAVFDMGFPSGIIYDAKTGLVKEGFAAIERDDITFAAHPKYHTWKNKRDGQGTYPQFHVAYDLTHEVANTVAPPLPRQILSNALMEIGHSFPNYADPDFNSNERNRLATAFSQQYSIEFRVYFDYRNNYIRAGLCSEVCDVIRHSITDFLHHYPAQSHELQRLYLALENAMTAKGVRLFVGDNAQVYNRSFYDSIRNGSLFIQSDPIRINEQALESFVNWTPSEATHLKHYQNTTISIISNPLEYIDSMNEIDKSPALPLSISEQIKTMNAVEELLVQTIEAVRTYQNLGILTPNKQHCESIENHLHAFDRKISAFEHSIKESKMSDPDKDFLNGVCTHYRGAEHFHSVHKNRIFDDNSTEEERYSDQQILIITLLDVLKNNARIIANGRSPKQEQFMMNLLAETHLALATEFFIRDDILDARQHITEAIMYASTTKNSALMPKLYSLKAMTYSSSKDWTHIDTSRADYYTYLGALSSITPLDKNAYCIYGGEAALLNNKHSVGTPDVWETCFVTITCKDPHQQNPSLVFNTHRCLRHEAIGALLRNLPQNAPWDVNIISAVNPQDRKRIVRVENQAIEVISQIRAIKNDDVTFHINLQLPCCEGVTYDGATGKISIKKPVISRDDGETARILDSSNIMHTSKGKPFVAFKLAYNLIGHDDLSHAMVNPRRYNLNYINFHARIDPDDIKNLLQNPKNKNYSKVVVEDHKICYSADSFVALSDLQKLCRTTKLFIEKAIDKRLKEQIEKHSEFREFDFKQKDNMLKQWRGSLLKDIEDSGLKIAIGTDPKALNPELFKTIETIGLILQQNHLIFKQKQFSTLAQQQEDAVKKSKSSVRATTANRLDQQSQPVRRDR
ncbi:MAG: hypothetical protein IPP74_03805 [Alphaproteobacteria bacterium]|nr:hypothetical protein [Alphaproteobacteria bacterium]